MKRGVDGIQTESDFTPPTAIQGHIYSGDPSPSYSTCLKLQWNLVYSKSIFTNKEYKPDGLVYKQVFGLILCLVSEDKWIWPLQLVLSF